MKVGAKKSEKKNGDLYFPWTGPGTWNAVKQRESGGQAGLGKKKTSFIFNMLNVS